MPRTPASKSARYCEDDSLYDDSEEDADRTPQYLLLFAGLTLAQLTAATTHRFKFSSQDKVVALRHAVKHAYGAYCPPSLEVFLDLACRHLPVPLGHGLPVIETCLRGLQGLVEAVFFTAQVNGLIHSTNHGPGSWDIQVSSALAEWDGTGGWKAVSRAISSNIPDTAFPARALLTRNRSSALDLTQTL